MYIDIYAEKYQKINGFKIQIIDKPKNTIAYLSFKASTRSVYDLSMRENFVDGMITMCNIEDDLRPSQVFFIDGKPDTKYILQSVNLIEHQTRTRTINAVKSNCLITIERFGFADKLAKEKTWNTVYKDVVGFTFTTLKDSKNFNAGTEVASVVNIQIPKFDIDNNPYLLRENDKIIIIDPFTNQKREIVAEGIDAFGITGVIRIYATLDMRVKDGIS